MKNLALYLLIIVVSCQRVDHDQQNQEMDPIDQTIPQLEFPESQLDSLASMLRYDMTDSSYIHKYYDSSYLMKQHIFFKISRRGDISVYSSYGKDLEQITCRIEKLEVEWTPVLHSPVERTGDPASTLLELPENSRQHIHDLYLAVKEFTNEDLFVKFDTPDSFMERIWTTEEKDAFVGTYLYAYYLKTTNK